MGDIGSFLMPLFAVVMVIAAAYLTAKWVAGRHNAYSSGRHIKVVERVMLAKDAYLALVQVGSKSYLASVTLNRVEIIGEINGEDLVPTEPAHTGSDFFGILSDRIGKKKQNPLRDRDSQGQDGAGQ